MSDACNLYDMVGKTSIVLGVLLLFAWFAWLDYKGRRR